MHHTITYHLIQARMADLRHHASRDTLARAARSRGRRRRDGLRPFGGAPDPGRVWRRPGDSVSRASDAPDR